MESDAWDAAWLEAEMARELAACHTSDEDEGVDEDLPPGPEVEPEASDGAFESSAMDALASYITSRDSVYGEMHRNLEQDMQEVTQLAGQIRASAPEEEEAPAGGTPEPAATATGPRAAPEPEPEGQAAEEPPPPPPPPPSQRRPAETEQHLAADRERRLQTLKNSFAGVENTAESFLFNEEKDKLGVDMTAAPATAGAAASEVAGGSADVSVGGTEEETAGVARPPGMTSSVESGGGADEEDEGLPSPEAKLRMQMQRLEDDERAEAGVKAEADAERARLQAQQAEASRHLLELQLEQQQRRLEFRDETAKNARDKFERETLQRAAAAEQHREQEEAARVRAAEQAEQLEKDLRERTGSLQAAEQQRRHAVEKEQQEEQARLARIAKEQDEIKQAIAAREVQQKVEEEEREKVLKTRQIQRAKQREARDTAWATEQRLLSAYECARDSQSIGALRLVLDEMQEIDRLDVQYAEGKQLVVQWRMRELQEMLGSICNLTIPLSVPLSVPGVALEPRAHSSSEEEDGEGEPVRHLVAACEIAFQARQAIAAESEAEIVQLIVQMEPISELNILMAECKNVLSALSSKDLLLQTLENAESTWDMEKLQDVLDELNKYGAPVQNLIGRCECSLEKLASDRNSCESLQDSLNQSSSAVVISAIDRAGGLVTSGSCSDRLRELHGRAKAHTLHCEEIEQMRVQLAAIGGDDIGGLEEWILQAQKYQELKPECDGARRKVGQRQQRDAIKSQISEAIDKHDDAALAACLAAVSCEEEEGLVSELQMAHTTLDLWQAQSALCKKMKVACAAPNRSSLRECISAVAADSALTCPGTESGLEECRRVLETLDNEDKLTQGLLEAVQTRDVDKLTAAITAARTAARCCQALATQVRGAESMRKELTQADQLGNSIAAAYQQRSLHHLTELMRQPKAAGLIVLGKPAGVLLDELGLQHAALKAVLDAFADCDTRRLSAAVLRIQEDDFLSKTLGDIIALVMPKADLIVNSLRQIAAVPDNRPHRIAAQMLGDARAAHFCQAIASAQAIESVKLDSMQTPPARAPVLKSALTGPNHGDDGDDDDTGLGADPDAMQRLDMGLEDLQLVPDLSDYERLLSVNLKVNKISNANGLDKCLQLHEVFLNDNKIKTLDGALNLPKLRTLSVEINQLESLSGIEHCNHLRCLLASNNSIEDIKALEKCRELERISLYRNHVMCLDVMERLPWLQHLDVGRNQLVSISGLGKCPLLQTLVLYENQITELPADPAEMYLPLLRELWLSGNPLQKLDFTGWMPSLEHLHVSDALVCEVTSLHQNKLLRSIDLSFNQLSKMSDLTAFASCRSLEVIRLNDNPIAVLPDYKEALMNGLSSLREIDNEPVEPDFNRAAEKHKAFVASGWLLGSAKMMLRNSSGGVYSRPGWWLSQSGNIAWDRLLQMNECGKHLSLPSSETGRRVDTKCAWQSRSYSYMCWTQREKNNSLVKSHRRHTNARQQAGGDVMNYGKHLHVEEADAVQMRRQLSSHLAEHQEFAPAQHQHVFTKNRAYARRIDKWQNFRSAVAVQKVFRGWKHRKQIFEGRSLAARRIQGHWAEHRKLKMEAAGGSDARFIQAVFRGHKVRRKLKAALDSAKYMDEETYDDIDENEFAMPIAMDGEWEPDFRLSRNDSEPADEASAGQAARPDSDMAPLANTTGGGGGGPQVGDGLQRPIRPYQAFQQAAPSEGSSDFDAGEVHGGGHGLPGRPGSGYPPSPLPITAPSTASSTSSSVGPPHASRVAGLMERMQLKEENLANEWGLSDPRTIDAMAKKARKYRRHEQQAKQKHSTASDRLNNVRARNGGTQNYARIGSASPTPPSTARSEPQHRSGAPLVRRLESAPPLHSPAGSVRSDNGMAGNGMAGGLMSFQSGEPNLRASRDLASRGSRDGRPNQAAQHAAIQNNFVSTPTVSQVPSLPPAQVDAPWGMAAGGGRIVVGRGGNAARKKKPKAKVPRVAQIRR